MAADPISAVVGVVAGIVLGAAVARRSPTPAAPQGPPVVAVVAPTVESVRLLPPVETFECHAGGRYLLGGAPLEPRQCVEVAVGAQWVPGEFMPRARRSVGGEFPIGVEPMRPDHQAAGVFVAVDDSAKLRRSNKPE